VALLLVFIQQQVFIVTEVVLITITVYFPLIQYAQPLAWMQVS